MQHKSMYCPQTNELAHFDLDNPNLLLNIYYQDDEGDARGMIVTVNFDGNNIEGLIKEKKEATQILADLKNNDVLKVDKIFVDPAVAASGESEGDEEGEEEDTDW